MSQPPPRAKSSAGKVSSWRFKTFRWIGVAAAAWLVAWAAARLLIVNVPLQQADVIVVLSGSGTYRERAAQAA